jgi:preprotein translocase subunit SecB
MKLITSQIQLKTFNLLDLDFKFNPQDKANKLKIEDLFLKYSLEIDFTWKKLEDRHLVFCHISINANESLKGYSIMAEGMGIFKLDIDVSNEVSQDLLRYSATSIVIQELRAIIRNVTANGPLGRYILPSIDIKEQVKLKFDLLKKAATKKRVIKS